MEAIEAILMSVAEETKSTGPGKIIVIIIIIINTIGCTGN